MLLKKLEQHLIKFSIAKTRLRSYHQTYMKKFDNSTIEPTYEKFFRPQITFQFYLQRSELMGFVRNQIIFLFQRTLIKFVMIKVRVMSFCGEKSGRYLTRFSEFFLSFLSSSLNASLPQFSLQHDQHAMKNCVKLQ